MNPFTLLDAGEAWTGLAVLAAMGLFIWWFVRRSGPTTTDKEVYRLGFNDGAEGRRPEKFENPRNYATYAEGYMDGSRGRTRRADAERLRQRASEPGK